MTDRDLLRRCGEALYGPRWQSDLARALGVSDRTVRRWIAGGQLPDGVRVDLSRLIQGRQVVLHKIYVGLADAYAADLARLVRLRLDRD